MVAFPSFCAVAVAGLHDIPDTIASRAVIIRMRRRAAGERVEPYRLRLHEWPRGRPVPDALRDVPWMLEELRVSHFAQALGTRGSVSSKRIRQALAAS